MAAPPDGAATGSISLDAKPQSGVRYAIEFRARPGGLAGHSYIAFGKLNESGRLRHPSYAGFRPDDGALGFIVGSVVAYSGTFSPSPDDVRGPVTRVYRRGLSTAQYRKIVAYVARARSNAQLWNLLGNNCNDFVSGAAEAIGLRTPSTLLPPDDFVEALKLYNEP